MSSSTEESTDSDLSPIQGGGDGGVKKKEDNESSEPNSSEQLWQTAVDPQTGKTYYYHVKTRETQWRKPIELTSKEELAAMAEKERRQKEFFAAMEANILKSISMGEKIPHKESLWKEADGGGVVVAEGDGGADEKAKADETTDDNSSKTRATSATTTTTTSTTTTSKEQATSNGGPKRSSPTKASKVDRRQDLVRTISTMDSSVLKELLRVPSARKVVNAFSLDDTTDRSYIDGVLTTTPSARKLGNAFSLDNTAERSSASLNPMENMDYRTSSTLGGGGDRFLFPVREASGRQEDDDSLFLEAGSDHKNCLSRFQSEENHDSHESLLVQDLSHNSGSNNSLDFSMLSESPSRADKSSFGWGNMSTSFLEQSIHDFDISKEESTALKNLAKIAGQMARVDSNGDTESDSESQSETNTDTKRSPFKQQQSQKFKSKSKTRQMASKLPFIDDVDDDVFQFEDDGDDGHEAPERQSSEMLRSQNSLLQMNSFKLEFENDGSDFEDDDGEYSDGVESLVMEEDDDLFCDNDAQDFPAGPLKTSDAPAQTQKPSKNRQKERMFSKDAGAGQAYDLNQGISDLDFRTSIKTDDFTKDPGLQPERTTSKPTTAKPTLNRTLRSKTAYSSMPSASCSNLKYNAMQADEDDKKRKLRSRPRLSRRNTCSTLYVGTTMSAPDKDGTIKCVCGVYRAHILQSSVMEDYHYDMHKYRVFNDLDERQTPISREKYHPSMDLDPSDKPPTLDEISAFYRDVFRRAQMEADCIIMSLIYVERLIKATEGALRPRTCNWRSILFSCMVLSSKVWDDMSMWNADFSQTCPSGIRFPLKRINGLEVAVLSALNYKVKVRASEYAKYYFLMRTMLIKSGLVGDVNASTPLDVEGAKRLQEVSGQFQQQNKTMKQPHSTSKTTNDSTTKSSKGGGTNRNRRMQLSGSRSKSMDQEDRLFLQNASNAKGLRNKKVSLEHIVNM